MPTYQAHRAQKARRIIRDAYGETRARQTVRVELLGDSVAIAILHTSPTGDAVRVKVARVLPDGRVSRMLKESRVGFTSVRDQIKYFESMYRRFGLPE